MFHQRTDIEFSASGVLFVDDLGDGVFSIVYCQPYGNDYMLSCVEVDTCADWIEREELEDYADDPIETDEDLAIVALDYYGLSEFGDPGRIMGLDDVEEIFDEMGIGSVEWPW